MNETLRQKIKVLQLLIYREKFAFKSFATMEQIYNLKKNYYG